MLRRFFTIFVLLAVLQSPAQASALRRLVLTAGCVIAMGAAGCGTAEQRHETYRQAAVTVLKDRVALASKDDDSRMLALRYFAASADLVQLDVTGANATTQPSEKYFYGVYFAQGKYTGEVVPSVAFFNQLTSTERARFEVELESLAVFFTERFKLHAPKRLSVNALNSYNSRVLRTTTPIQVVFTRGGGSSSRDATSEEVTRALRSVAADHWVTGVEFHKGPVKLVTLDIEDLAADHGTLSKWRQLLAAPYPGEF